MVAFIFICQVIGMIN